MHTVHSGIYILFKGELTVGRGGAAEPGFLLYIYMYTYMYTYIHIYIYNDAYSPFWHAYSI